MREQYGKSGKEKERGKCEGTERGITKGEREKRTGLRTSEGRRGLLLIPAHEVNKRKGERNRNERNG